MKRVYFLSLKSRHGTVLPTTSFVSGDKAIPYFNETSLKFGTAANGSRWQDFAFGMPYMGMGVSYVNYFRDKDLGSPIIVYLFQGSSLTDFNKKAVLNYEWKAGASFNWKPYDPFDNPMNNAIGSPVNIYAGIDLYVKWKLNNKIDLNTGVSFEHNSNGAFRYPNNGINQLSGFLELSYYFNRKVTNFHHGRVDFPDFEKSREHDLMFMVTSRNAKIDTIGARLASPYIERNFVVLGGSYAYMINNHYRHRWGPTIEVTYDESAGVSAWNQTEPKSGHQYVRIQKGNFGDRFSLGLGIKGEIKMPLYSAFINLGYDVIHAKVDYSRFYQTFGVKVYLKENFFGVFGIRATNFGKSQYIYLNFGYTIKGRKPSNSPKGG